MNQQLIIREKAPPPDPPTFWSVRLLWLVLGYLVARKLIKNFTPKGKKSKSVKSTASNLSKALGITPKNLKTLDNIAKALLVILVPLVMYNVSTRYLFPNIISSSAGITTISQNKLEEYYRLKKMYSYKLFGLIQNKDTQGIDKIIESLPDKSLINLILQELEIASIYPKENYPNIDWGVYLQVYQKYSRDCRLSRGRCNKIFLTMHPDKFGGVESPEFKSALFMVEMMKRLYGT